MLPHSMRPSFASGLLLFTASVVHAQPVYQLTRIDNFFPQTGINDAGQIAGESAVEPGYCNSVSIYSNGSVNIFGGACHDYVVALNNLGQVIGNGYGWGWLYTNGVQMWLPPVGNGYANPYAINDVGQVVGGFFSDGVAHAFLYSNGAVNDLGALGASNYSAAFAINKSGQIVGESSTTGNGPTHAFLFSNGAMTDLGTLGGTTSSATAINVAGDVIGTSATAAGTQHAFIYRGSAITDLGTLGGLKSKPIGINASGTVAGVSDTATSAQHAFIYRRGKIVDLGTLGGTSSHATAINDAGDVVGDANIAGDAATHAFVYSKGTIFDLNTRITPAALSTTLSGAGGINSSGWIVAEGYDSASGESSAYLLTPTVPPAPTGLTATSKFSGSMLLKWTGSLGATNYNIYMGITPGGESATPIKTGVIRTRKYITQLTSGATYYFRAAAVNDQGIGPLSDEVSVTIK